jgi:sulfur carrier protein
MEITVNQQIFEVEDLCSVLDMLALISDVPDKGIAIAINQTIILKPDWSVHMMQPGDQVMIIKATQGG